MKVKIRQVIYAIGVVFLSGLLGSPVGANPARAKHIILFIGDGMGPEQVKAGSLFSTGKVGGLSFEQFPHQSLMTTEAEGHVVTDSAASATAIATGHVVKKGVLSQSVSVDGKNYPTVLEICQKRSMGTGLVTTTDVTDATPAAFGAHSASRKNHEAIQDWYLNKTKPNLLFGTSPRISIPSYEKAGYRVVTNRTSLEKIVGEHPPYVAGVFSRKENMEWAFSKEGQRSQEPNLTEMTEAALALLEKNTNGFFLLIENEGMDVVGHRGDLNSFERTRRLVYEVRALALAVEAAVKWAERHEGTLIVVAADHETGGFSLYEGMGTKGVVPNGQWTTTRHTSAPVFVYGWGMGAEAVRTIKSNADLFRVLLP